jgi:hypothetical protein
VSTMFSTFRDALAFNQPIGKWSVASVSNMRSMFYDAKSFAQDISVWNVTRKAALAGRATPSPLCVAFLRRKKTPPSPSVGACPRPSAAWMQTRSWRRAWRIAS